MTRSLFDTHLLLWSVTEDPKLTTAARLAILDPQNEPWFSLVSIWEIAIKFAKRSDIFPHAPMKIRTTLLDRGWQELDIQAEHLDATTALPPLHGDPFDRLLLAQARVEGMTLVTGDQTVAQYSGPVLRV